MSVVFDEYVAAVTVTTTVTNTIEVEALRRLVKETDDLNLDRMSAQDIEDYLQEHPNYLPHCLLGTKQDKVRTMAVYYCK